MSQSKLGKNEAIYEEKCWFCKKELLEPEYYTIYRQAYPDEKAAVCDGCQGWKNKMILNWLEFLVIVGTSLAIPLYIVYSIYGEAKKILEHA